MTNPFDYFPSFSSLTGRETLSNILSSSDIENDDDDGDDSKLQMTILDPGWDMLVALDDVDTEILRERQDAIHEIEKETLTISEIMESIAALLPGQGENLNLASANVERSVEATGDAVIALENAVSWNQKLRGLVFDATAAVAGSGLGALGFLGGPLIGVPTLVGGIITASSIIIIRRILAK